MPQINEETNDNNAFVTFKRFMEFLMSDPTPNSICQHIGLNWPSHPHAVFVGLRLVASDASLVLVGHFGASEEEIQPFAVTSLWEHTPASRAIRERSSIVLKDRQSIEALDPVDSGKFPDLRAVIALPLITQFDSIGTLEVAFTEDLPDPESTESFLSLWADALTLHSRTWVVKKNGDETPSDDSKVKRKTQSLRVVASEDEPDQVDNLDERELTRRQHTILQLMSLQFTNRRIALRLGYSESTVRQDTMAIFAFLKVDNRKEAVEQGIVRGLIQQPAAEV